MLVTLEGYEETNLNGRQKIRGNVNQRIFRGDMSSGSMNNANVAFSGMGLDGYEDDWNLGKFKIKKAVKKAVKKAAPKAIAKVVKKAVPKPIAQIAKKAIPAPIKQIAKVALKIPVVPTPANLKKMANTVIKVSNNPVIKAVAAVYPPAGMALKMVNQADMISKNPRELLNVAEMAAGRELVPDEVKAIMETKDLITKGEEVSQQIDAGEAPVMAVSQTESLSSRVDNVVSSPAYTENLPSEESSDDFSPNERASINLKKTDLRTRAEKYYDAGLLK